MEKINYGYVLEQYYPDCKWKVQEGRKSYEYTAYIFYNEQYPTQKELEDLWKISKRKTWMWQEIIKKRDLLLQESDKYVLPDYPHKSENDYENWLKYRQELRDLTETAIPTVNQQNTIIIDYPKKPNIE